MIYTKGEKTPNDGMYVGPYSKASTAKLKDGITEETYVEVDLEKLSEGEYFEVSLALKTMENSEEKYVSEAVVMTQKNNGVVNVTASWAGTNPIAVIKESGIYTYQWKMFTEDENTYVKFTLLKNEEVVGTTNKVDMDSDSLTTEDTQNPIAEQENVSVKYLWFCNVNVASGVNVYAQLPKVEEEPPVVVPSMVEEAETPVVDSTDVKEKDVTPKTGVIDTSLYVCAVLAVISLAGLIAVKKYNK